MKKGLLSCIAAVTMMASNAAMVALLACENDPVAMPGPHRDGYKGMGVGREGKKSAGLGGAKYLTQSFPVTLLASFSVNHD